MSLYMVLCVIIVLLNLKSSSQVSMSVVSVCPGGQQTLTCHTNMTVLIWSVTLPDFQQPEMRFIDSLGSADSQATFTINHTVFQFLRTSVSPLISTVVIDNVATTLNGTRVDCLYGGTTSTMFISVIRNGTTVQSQPLIIESEAFSPDAVSIVVHWEQQDNVLYSLSVSPELEATVRFVGSDRVQVTLFYNIRYNLSIVGTLCGQNINTTDVIELHYVRCSHPPHLLADDHFITIKGPRDNYLVPNISFSCNGSAYAITCMENGEWEPDPREINCRGISLPLTPVVQNGITGVITVFSAITITVCAANSLVFLMIGYTCGWLGHKRKQSLTHKATSAKKNICAQPSQVPPTPGPIYEELQPTSMPEDQAKAFELIENVAYDPI